MTVLPAPPSPTKASFKGDVRGLPHAVREVLNWSVPQSVALSEACVIAD